MPDQRPLRTDHESLPSPDAVWCLCGAWIRRTAIRIRDRMPWAEVDDLVQHGALTALEMRDEYDETRGHGFLTFVRPRVFGSMIDSLRQQGAIARRAYAATDASVMEDAADYDSAVEILIRQENIESVMANMANLDDDERTAISLFYLEEFTNKEVAEAMRVSEGQATKLRTRAIHRLAGMVAGRVPGKASSFAGNPQTDVNILGV